MPATAESSRRSRCQDMMEKVTRNTSKLMETRTTVNWTMKIRRSRTSKPLNQTKKMDGAELMEFYEKDKNLGKCTYLRGP